MTDLHWYRSLLGGYWIHRPHVGWQKVSRREASIWRNNSLLQPRVIVEDHSHNDGLFALTVAIMTVVIAYRWWFA